MSLLRSLTRLAGQRSGYGASSSGLAGLVGGGLSAALAPRKPAYLLRLQALSWALCGVATILLLVGFWRLAELALGPILAPLVSAAVLGTIATILYLIVMYKERDIVASKPKVPTDLLVSLLEIWLTPRSFRRSMVAGMALNWVHRNVLGR